MILDGGLATELEQRGYDVSSSLWSARLLKTAPDAIEQLHYDYYSAGARCAISASYQASYEGFAALGLSADETTVLLRLSVELAQSARARWHRDHADDRRKLYVAASVGPYGAILHDGSEYRGDYGLSVKELIEFHSRRFEVLATSGADFLACETLPVLDEARALAVLLARFPDALAWMSFTSPDGIQTSHGESLTECARILDRVPNVIAVGVNCVKPEIVGAAIGALKAGTSKAIRIAMIAMTTRSSTSVNALRKQLRRDGQHRIGRPSVSKDAGKVTRPPSSVGSHHSAYSRRSKSQSLLLTCRG